MDFTQTALQSSKMLLNLLNDLLDMSQIKAGKFKLVLEQFNICDLLNEVQKMMLPLARNKDNMIIVQFEENVGRNYYFIKNDKYRIRQILINLISNSIKYTHKANIYISVIPDKADKRYLRVSVRDEGIGIKKEFRQNLFQAFGMMEDMESKTKHNPNGVGLGLLISNIIAKNLKPKLLHTGSIESGGTLHVMRSVSIQSSGSLIPTCKELRVSSSSFAQEEGLLLNEQIEKGSEFYFTIFNYNHNTEKCIYPKATINLQLKKRSSLFAREDSQLSPLSRNSFNQGLVEISSNSEESQQHFDTEPSQMISSMCLPNIPRFEESYNTNNITNLQQNTRLQQSNVQNSIQIKLNQPIVENNIQILIVDDEQFSALALQSRISSAFRVYNKNFSLHFTTLYSGQECLELLKNKTVPYCFLFIDSQMPEMDGFDTVRQIDKQNLRANLQPNGVPFESNTFKRIEIVLCSGFQKDENKLYIYKISHFIQKPVEQEGLLNIFRQTFLERSPKLSKSSNSVN